MNIDKLAAKHGFSPEPSGGGCMWYIKKVFDGTLVLIITDLDGMRLPESPNTPILVGMQDVEGIELACTEHKSFNHFVAHGI
jgi:hypothetical protein